MRHARLLLLLLAMVSNGFLVAPAATPAQPVEAPVGGTPGSPVHVRAELLRPSGAITIGDPLDLVIRIEGDPGAQPGLLHPSDEELGSFKLLGSHTDEKTRTIRLRLTPLAVGSLSIPPIEVPFRTSSGKEERGRTETVPIEVVSVVEEGKTELADIKPPAEIRPDWRALLPWIGGGAALLAAAAAAFVYWRGRARRPSILPGLDPLARVDPHRWAREALDRLLGKGYLEQGSMKPFCVELSDVVRQYLEYRYWIPAPERTTGEIAAEMARALVPEEVRVELLALLERCDEVKFAERSVQASECRRWVESLTVLLEKTRPRREGAAVPLTAAAS